MNHIKPVSAVDLFCGVGGLTNGLVASGVKVVAGFDIDQSCQHAYEINNNGAKFFHKDVAKITGEELSLLYPNEHIKLLAGCAPCQPFSTYSQGRDAKKDKKWPLLYEFSRLIKEIEPELVTMENVPDVTKHKVYHDFVDDLKKLGYQVVSQTAYCPDYGIPQRRKRHVLMASKLGDIDFIKATHKKNEYVTVKDAIGDLLPISAGKQSETDPLHISAGLSALNMQRIKISRPGGSWKDWPESLRANCHRKSSGKTYSGVYARMEWRKPAPTMTTQCFGYGNGRFGHPEQDRAISLREAAIFQSFPRDYQFIADDKKLNISAIGRMIGNAVPPKLAQAIGKQIINHIG